MREPKKEIYNDAWFFYKKYLNGDRSDRYWEDVNREGQTLVTKHNGDMFMRSLVSSIITELQRKE